MAVLGKVVYLTEAQKTTLFSTGSVTSNGTTITYSPNDLYVTPDISDPAPVSGSTNPITSGAVYAALQSKQDTLTFDTTPTANSTNPVTSGGIFTAVNSGKVWFGVCDTAASTAAKTATISGITAYQDGLNVRIKFTYTNSASSSPSLNINSLGAKSIYYLASLGDTLPRWAAGEIVDLVYYNDHWVLIDAGMASTSAYGVTRLSDSVSSTSTGLAATANSVKQAYDRGDAAYTLANSKTGVVDGVSGTEINRYGTCSTAAGTAAKVATLSSGTLDLDVGTRISIDFAYPNTATQPTLNVNGSGAKNILVASHMHDGLAYGQTFLSQGQENMLSGVCDFVYNGTHWVLVSSGTSMRNEVVYSSTAPTSPLTGTVWLKPAEMTIQEAKCLIVTTGAISSLPTTISNANITSDMVVINQEISNPSAQQGDWTWTTANGSLTLSGTINGSTYVTLYLLKSR